MTPDDLRRVNAALRLGDPAVPPEGSVVMFGREPELWTVSTAFVERRSIAVDVFRETYPGISSTSYDVPGDVPPTVVSVPPGSPPFELWLRFPPDAQ